jgi:hypothetical protein
MKIELKKGIDVESTHTLVGFKNIIDVYIELEKVFAEIYKSRRVV